MPQTRYFLRADKVAANRISAEWETAFGDEGAPVGVTEIDETGDVHEVSIYFDGIDEDRLGAVAGVLDPSQGSCIETEIIPDTDWMKLVLAELKPVRAGRFVVHGFHDRKTLRANEIAIEIEAGQAFGTGHHGTTAGCLEAIDRLVRKRRPMNVLDLGTGTAVLAIGVAKAARATVLATDIDPVATRVAKENVELNRIRKYVKTETATGLSSRVIRRRAPYDLIVANILAGPLMRLAPAVARSLRGEGCVVLSGILERQRRAVLAAYRIQGLYHRRTIRRGEWVTLLLSR